MTTGSEPRKRRQNHPGSFSGFESKCGTKVCRRGAKGGDEEERARAENEEREPGRKHAWARQQPARILDASGATL